MGFNCEDDVCDGVLDDLKELLFNDTANNESTNTVSLERDIIPLEIPV